MLGILCGFAAEKKIAVKFSPLVTCSGAREERCREQAAWLVDQGATSLLSFGVSGGLHPGLDEHSVIIGTHVVDMHGKRHACDMAMVARFSNAASHALTGHVYGSNVIVGSSDEKDRIHAETQALIVDMESHILAETAAKHGLPFMVLRGVSDDAGAPLPEAVLHGINEDGSENIPGVLKSLLRDPTQLPSLLGFARNTNTALRELEKVLAQVNKQQMQKQAA